MSEAHSRGHEPPRRDLLLTVGVALVLIGALAVIASAVRGELLDAALAVIPIVAGALLWRWRHSVVSRH